MTTLTTRDVLADRRPHEGELVAAGPQVEMVFQSNQRALSLRAGKMWHLLIKKAGARLGEDVTHTMPLAELATSGIGHLTRAERLEVLHELMRTLVNFPVVNLSKGQTSIRSRWRSLVSAIDIDDDESGNFSWKFSDLVQEMLADSNYWAVLDKKATMAFKSKYGLRWYEILSLRGKLDRKTAEVFQITDLRARLGIDAEKYADWAQLKRDAVDKPLKEVAHLTSIEASYTIIKTGRKVTAIRVTWATKSAQNARKSADELARHSAGREARREQEDLFARDQFAAIQQVLQEGEKNLRKR